MTAEARRGPTQRKGATEMAARIVERGDRDVVVAAPAGEYGFGTLGLANQARTLDQAWRMVQRAGLATRTDRASGRIVGTRMHTAAHVEYDLS